MIRFTYFLLLLLIPEITFSQISGIVNSYVKVIAVDNSCNKLTIDPSIGLNTGNFVAGTKVLIIQMKGASMNTSNNTSFGTISSLNDAGNYEFAEIYGVLSNGAFNDVYIKNALLKSYTPSGYVQMVTVPTYSDVTVTGTLTAKSWDGNTGGVLVFEATGTVTLNANIDVSGLGFQGGNSNPGSGSACAVSNYTVSSSSDVSGAKGEGIANTITNNESGAGKQANGGGGGNSNNCGGGGGGNYGAGGTGGTEAYLRTSAYSGCNLYGTGTPGIGGLALTYSNASNKIFLGGGAGGGHQNNWASPGPPTYTGGTPGGPGGGIVMIKANTLNANGNSIVSKGKLNSTIYRAWGDGAGGGGAGGTVLLSIDNYQSSVTVDVSGSKGDNVYDETSRDLGPGGGGGGGIIWVSGASLSSSITAVTAGGTAGTMVGTTTCQCSHNATAGSNGGTLTGLAFPKSSTAFTPCVSLPVTLISFKAYSLSDRIRLEWFTASEKDNEEYMVEKTTDLATYELVSTIKSAKNNYTTHAYVTYDFSPSLGKVYYRLSQKDADGKISRIGMAMVELTEEKNIILRISPVPFSDNLNLILNPSTTEARIQLVNAIGELVYDHRFFREDELALQFPYLPSGIYQLIVYSELGIEMMSILKEK